MYAYSSAPLVCLTWDWNGYAWTTQVAIPRRMVLSDVNDIKMAVITEKRGRYNVMVTRVNYNKMTLTPK